MTQQNHNSSKPCGGWAIVWTKSRSLYSFILVRISGAVVLSVFLLLIMMMASNALLQTHSRSQYEKKVQTVNAIYNSIQQTVTDSALTYEDAASLDFSNRYPNYYILFVPDASQSVTQVPNTFQSSSLMDFSMPFSYYDAEGFIIIAPNLSPITFFIYGAIPPILTICFFIIFAMWLLSPMVRYLQTIKSGIHTISRDDLLHKIPKRSPRELGELADDINLMGERLHEKMENERKMEQSQRSLVTNMSHDLRTPLTSIVGYLALAKASSITNSITHSHIQTAIRATDRLTTLIDDLFLYNKLVSGDIVMQKQPTDIARLLRQIIELRTRNIAFIAPDSAVMLDVDISHFHRIMENLLSNAEKYSPEDSTILLRIDRNGDETLIEVENESTQDLTDQMHLLCDRLYTGNHARTDGSTGLGLAIVTQLTAAMGGVCEPRYKDGIFTVKITLW